MLFDCCLLLATASIWSDNTLVDCLIRLEFKPCMLSPTPLRNGQHILHERIRCHLRSRSHQHSSCFSSKSLVQKLLFKEYNSLEASSHWKETRFFFKDSYFMNSLSLKLMSQTPVDNIKGPIQCICFHMADYSTAFIYTQRRFKSNRSLGYEFILWLT